MEGFPYLVQFSKFLVRKRRDAILLHEDLQFSLSVDAPRFGAGLRQGFLGARVIAEENRFADALGEHLNPTGFLCLQQCQQYGKSIKLGDLASNPMNSNWCKNKKDSGLKMWIACKNKVSGKWMDLKVLL